MSDGDFVPYVPVYYNMCPKFIQELSALSKEITATHQAHYQTDEQYGLVNPKNNSDHVYHLYEDGELTHQKGGFCYLQRSEFQEMGPVILRNRNSPYGLPTPNLQLIGLSLPLQRITGSGDRVSYAILTEEEGVLLCNKVIRLHNKYSTHSRYHRPYLRPIWPQAKIDAMMRKVNEEDAPKESQLPEESI